MFLMSSLCCEFPFCINWMPEWKNVQEAKNRRRIFSDHLSCHRESCQTTFIEVLNYTDKKSFIFLTFIWKRMGKSEMFLRRQPISQDSPKPMHFPLLRQWLFFSTGNRRPFRMPETWQHYMKHPETMSHCDPKEEHYIKCSTDECKAKNTLTTSTF